MSEPCIIRTVPLMGTLVTIQIVRRNPDSQDAPRAEDALDRAFAWFRQVEQSCTRFDPQSEVMQLVAQVGVPVSVSPLLYQAVHFALAVARESDGAFDPTVGHAMETRGFNREYRSGQTVHTAVAPGDPVSYKDLRLDAQQQTITLLRPLILDLGAVAKGLAVDLAARELQPFRDFAVDAGGDLYLGGLNSSGEPWSIGIRHPRRDGELIDSIRVSNRAVCTSGDYERPAPMEAGGHHILDPRNGVSPQAVASVTVVAPTAILADAIATAAFVLGPADGIRLFDRLGVDGFMISSALERFSTRGMCSDHHLGSSTVLSHAQRPSYGRADDSVGPRSAV